MFYATNSFGDTNLPNPFGLMAEGDQVFIGEALPTKQENRMIEPGAVDGVEFVVADPPQIDVFNSRAQWLS